MIRTKLRVLVLAFALTAGIGLGVSGHALAVDPLASACSTSPDSATCKSYNPFTNPLTGTNGTLYKITTIVATVAGIAAIFVIIVSGVRYMTSGGDTQKVAAAKRTLIGAIVGLVIIVLAQTIITFVVRRL